MSYTEFIFDEKIEPHRGDLRLEVPMKLSNKKALFAALREQLRLPEYFAENWDAFEECVRDLSWLPAGRVILIHVDVPLPSDLTNARTYIAILDDAVRKMATSKDHPLAVMFPSILREQVEWLLRSSRVRTHDKSR